MSALIAVLGIACFALGVTAALKGGLIERVSTVGWFLVSGPFQLARDLPLLKQWASQRGAPVDLTAAQGWIVPLAFGTVFVALFAAANPLIANWFAQWSLAPSLNQLDMQRLMFWIGTIIAVWAFVRVCGRFALPDTGLSASDIPEVTSSGPIFNDAAVMRSLVLFNLLFAVQSVMDINYLWAGAALPDGMTYATYAHRGAYPLIATALLAAAFVIVAMRPGSDAERSPLMRALVFLWVGQNVLLVVSAMLRLDLYVATYLLTYWRVAAFIWMLIVAAGLVLIVVRIVTYRSNAWLIVGQRRRAGADDLRLQLREFRQSGRELQRRACRRLGDGRPPDRPHLCYCAWSAGDPRPRPVSRCQSSHESGLLPAASRLAGSAARERNQELARLDVPRLAADALPRKPAAALTPP